MNHNEEHPKSGKINRFLDWQQLSIKETGIVVNLFLGISFATIGFVMTQLTSENFNFINCWDKLFFSSGGLILIAYIVVSLSLVLNRLKDFKKTTELVRTKNVDPNNIEKVESLRLETEKLGKKTWRLFYLSLWLFGIAELLIVFGFTVHIIEKF